MHSGPGLLTQLRHLAVQFCGVAFLCSGCPDAHDMRDAGVPFDAATSGDAGTSETGADAGNMAQPAILWVSDMAGRCSSVLTPSFAPQSSVAGPPGSERWPGPVRGSGRGVAPYPSFAGEGLYWTSDLFTHDFVDFASGAEDLAVLTMPGVPAPSPDELGSVWRYRKPLMSLGRSILVSRDAYDLYYADVSIDSGFFRRWSFPEVDDFVRRDSSLPSRNDTLDHVMPAWSPVSGQVAYTSGYDNDVLAVMCPENDGGQFVIGLPHLSADQYRVTSLFFSETGELLVHHGQLFVFARTGELLRVGSPPPGMAPQAYAPECGMLYRRGDSWAWMDVESMSLGAEIDMSEFLGVSGASDCTLLGGTRTGVVRVDTDGRHSPQVDGSVQELRDGSLLVFRRDTREVSIVDATGATLRVVTRLEGGGVLGIGPFWTPTGDVVFLSGGGYYDVGAPPPGPLLWLDSGLNWAHTNSPLP